MPTLPSRTACATVLTTCAFLLLAGRSHAASEERLTSLYTDLAEERCQTLEIRDDEGASSLQRCPGAAGYHLLVLDADARMSITLVDPAGGEHPLHLWTLVSSSFSSLGPVAEWRMARRSGTELPVALIVRFNAADPETGKVTSYLAVAKIAEDGICLVEAIPPGPNANQKARDVADVARTKACLKEPGGVRRSALLVAIPELRAVERGAGATQLAGADVGTALGGSDGRTRGAVHD